MIYGILILYWLLWIILSYVLMRNTDSFSIFNPITMVVTLIFIGTVLKLSYLAFFADSLFLNKNMLNHEPFVLVLGTFCLSVFMFFLILGFFSVGKVHNLRLPALVRISYRGGQIWSLLVIGGIILIALFSLYAFIDSSGGLVNFSAKRFLGQDLLPSDRLESSGYLYFKLAQVSEISFYVSAFFYFVRKGYSKIWFVFAVVSFVCAVSTAMMFSNRVAILILLIDFMLIYSFFNVKKAVRFGIYLGGGLLVLILVTSALRDGGGDKGILDHFFGGKYLADITRISIIVDYLAKGGLFSDEFSSFGGFINSYMNRGRFVGENIYGTIGSGVPLGGVAELYSYLGIASIGSGAFFIGLIFRFVFRCLRSYKVSMFIFLFVILLYSRLVVFIFNNGMGVAVYQIFMDVVPLIIISVLLQFNTKKDMYVYR